MRSGVALERIEHVDERLRQIVIEQMAESVCHVVAEPLTAELPDHRAQLELGVERQAVVDAPEVPVARRAGQWPLLRSVLLATRSKAQMRCELGVELLVLVAA